MHSLNSGKIFCTAPRFLFLPTSLNQMDRRRRNQCPYSLGPTKFMGRERKTRAMIQSIQVHFPKPLCSVAVEPNPSLLTNPSNLLPGLNDPGLIVSRKQANQNRLELIQ